MALHRWSQHRLRRDRPGRLRTFLQARQLDDLYALQRLRQWHDGIDPLEERTCRFRVLSNPEPELRRNANHAERQDLLQIGRQTGSGDAEVQRVRHQKESPAHPANGSSPASRSKAQVLISGKPTSAVGSVESMLSSNAMPSVSDFALPAQS